MKLRALLPVTVAGLVLIGCAAGDDDPDSGPEAGQHDSSASGEAFAHIHGLGVADDVLYVATHHGLFALDDDGRAWMASQDDHDFMGFTIADTGEFLASGHPNSRTDLPGDLGLLESGDSGATWDTVSLSGEVDFHAIDAKNGSVYGYSSVTGELLTSTDRQTWTARGQAPLGDVAISPDDAATLAVTTEQGPQWSTDGGRTFTPVDAAPVVALIDWPRPTALYGVTPGGIVHLSDDGGASWSERARLDARPQALTVSPDGAIYVATDTTILVSRDDGDTFEPYYTWG